MENESPLEDTSSHDKGIVWVKTEPDVVEIIPNDETVSVDDPNATEPTIGEIDLFNETLAHLLDQFNQNPGNATLQDTTPFDSEYQEVVDDVERTQAEIARKESVGQSTDLDRVGLKSLEGVLNKLRKARAKENAFRDRAREIEENQLFYPEGDTDDDVKMTPALSRTQAMNENNLDTINISDDEEQEEDWGPPRNTKSRGSRGIKSITRGLKPAAKAESSRVQKRGRPLKKRGRSGRQGPAMLNMGSLLRNDIVADAAANQDAGDAPSFQGSMRNKKDALAGLLASIPKGEQPRGEKTALDKAARQFRWRGQGSMQVMDGGWRLKGMKTSLKNFQLLGAAWGCEREAGSEAPYGGMLADTMGYGKTVQMITIMMENQPKPRAKNRTTLIVLPNSIADQWMAEFVTHTDPGVMDNILMYKSGSRLQSLDPVAELKKWQIIITTYHEVMSNYPKCDPPVHLVTDKAKDEWWDKYYHEKKGPLLRIPFYRIVLDEAQIIKNHESRTSKACRLLTAKYKWVLSGTPLSNCMEELFSYFSFLGVFGAGSFAQFKANYAKRNTTTMLRLDAILKTIMIRRTCANRLLGRPLVSLPALDHQTIVVEFSPMEKAIYTVVRQRFINKINDWSTARKIGQLSKDIFVMLLRLRQMCAHIFMVNATVRDLLETEDIERLWKAVERYSGGDSATGQKTAEVLKQILTKAQDERESSTANDEIGSTQEDQNHQSQVIDLTINDEQADFRQFFYRLQRNGDWSKIQCRSICHSCGEVPDGVVKLSRPCGHFYCEECLEALIRSAESANTNATCSECQGAITGSADMRAMEQIAIEAGDQSRASTLAVQKKRKGKKEEPDTSWLDVPGAELMSTKVQAVVSTLEKWIETDPKGKIVVFTLFLPMVKVLAKVCSRRGWRHQEYTGAMTSTARNKALEEWKDPNKGNKVLLMSTKAGSLGLNLVEASYAVIVDPWWNQPVEDQAFSRIYRIGQQRDCIVRRIVINDAIDTQLMLHLQRVKSEECDRVIDGRSQDKLNVHDLMRLFGPTRRDPRTNEIIIEDGQEDTDGMDDFVMSEDRIVVDDSDGEEVSAAPSRSQE